MKNKMVERKKAQRDDPETSKFQKGLKTAHDVIVRMTKLLKEFENLSDKLEDVRWSIPDMEQYVIGNELPMEQVLYDLADRFLSENWKSQYSKLLGELLSCAICQSQNCDFLDTWAESEEEASTDENATPEELEHPHYRRNRERAKVIRRFASELGAVEEKFNKLGKESRRRKSA